MSLIRPLVFAVCFLALTSCHKDVRPLWSHYFPEEDFSLLRETLETFIADDQAITQRPKLDWEKATVKWKGEALDLRELVGYCYFAKPEEYREIISNSFSLAGKRLELLSKYRASYENVSELLSLKMVPAVEKTNSEFIARDFVPGISTLLVYDLGAWTLPVPKKDAGLWQRGDSVLFDRGRRQLLTHLEGATQVTTEEPLPGLEQSRFKKIFSRSSQTASLALVLNELKDLGSEKGFLFGLPDCNTILLVPLSYTEFHIRSSWLIKETMEQMNRSPFPLSSNFFLAEGSDYRQIPFLKMPSGAYLPSFPKSLQARINP